MKTLVVEDSEFMGRILQRALRERGHDVVLCTSAEEAWEQCMNHEFPLILSDWMLPGMDGLELCRRIRGLPWGDRSVILIVTGRSDASDLSAVLDAGASDYLPKPLTPELFQVRLAIAERQADDSAARRLAEAQLVEARAAAAESAAWRELSRQQRLMINVISHELNTPLSAILGFSELLLDRDLVPDLKEQIAAIHDGATRLNTLVRSIVDLSLLDSGEAKIDIQTIDLGTAIPEWATELACEPRLRVQVEADLPPVQGDWSRLRQAVHHLVNNALACSPETSSVTVNVRTEADGAITIDVRDLGEGIPAAELTHLFEPLYRTTRAHRDAVKGAGIGLALVRRIAELHGGSATVRSMAGEGTTFSLRLPTGFDQPD